MAIFFSPPHLYQSLQFIRFTGKIMEGYELSEKRYFFSYQVSIKNKFADSPKAVINVFQQR